jgi:hypothetical protein
MSIYLLVSTILVLIVCNVFVYCYIFSRIFTVNHVPAHTSGPATVANVVPRVRPLVDTWGNIHTFLTFDYNIPNPIAVANRYETVWGTSQKSIHAYRAGNPNILLSYYIPFNRDRDAHHDLSYWQSFHPDWVLYKCDGVTSAYEFSDPNIPLNFTNPSVIS